ncbi:MAG: type II secretion system protein [Dehalococcoidales bacterium]
MNRMFKKHRRGEKGFTLVELLIVFTLLAVLAAIMIPNVSGFVAYGHIQAAAAELSVVQTAMDSMMAVTNNSTVTQANNKQDMSTFPDSASPLYPGYLRFLKTKGTYDCSTSGLVSQNTTGYPP